MPNEAHTAAGLVSDIPTIPRKARIIHAAKVCQHPHCVARRKRFNLVRAGTTLVMLAATATGVVSYFAGAYVWTVLSPIFGMASHAIDTWVMEAAKDAYDAAHDFVIQEGSDNV